MVKKLLVAISMLFLFVASESMALTMLPLYGDDSMPWGTYGGDIVYGGLQWSAENGSANFTISLDSSFTIFGFSFNTNVASDDFIINIQDGSSWSYRGLNTSEGIGTDHFDFTIWRNAPGVSNILYFSIVSANITEDNDFYRSNLLPSNSTEWDALLHQSHFGVYASNAQGVYYILSDSFYDTSSNTALPVPEPDTFVLLSTGVVAGLLARRKYTF